MISPSPDIFYRIQNVDFATHLELPVAVNAQAVEPRILKDSPKQWWTFKQQGTGSNYKILNSSSPLKDTLFALSVEWKEKVIYVESAEKCNVVWNVGIPKVGEYCTISTTNPQRGTTLYLHMMRDGPTVSAENKRDNQAWRILEVSPSPPADTYRIRNMDGASVLTVHNEELGIHMQEYGKHQGWEVVPKGNGKCQIKKLDKDMYLGWEQGADETYKVKATSKALASDWIIKNIGGFAYAVTMFDKEKEYALTLVDETDVTLKARKTSYAQVWFFEPSKFVAAHDEWEDISRIPTISDGDYSIQNCSTSQFWTLENEPARINSSSTGAKLTLKYLAADSPYFTLQFKDSKLERFAVPWGDGLAVSDTSAVWYLQKEANAPGYFICAAGKRRLPRVVTNDTKLDVNGQKMWVLGDKKAKDTTQMWKLT